MEKINRDDIISKLREGVVRVNFTKKDGSVRDMMCTLVQSSIPQEMQPKGEGSDVTESVIRAFDVNAKGWRSFIVENINSIEFPIKEL